MQYVITAFSTGLLENTAYMDTSDHFPANPPLQVQLCPPTVLVQFAFTSQL